MSGNQTRIESLFDSFIAICAYSGPNLGTWDNVKVRNIFNLGMELEKDIVWSVRDLCSSLRFFEGLLAVMGAEPSAVLSTDSKPILRR